MKLRHIVSITFFTILSVLVYFSIYLGVFKPVLFDMGEFGPFHLVYKNHLGAYHKMGPVIESVEQWVKSKGQSCAQSFGEYIDDPQQVEQERLRSLGGCIVDKHFDQLPSDFEQKTLEKQFFIRGQFEGSPAIGPYKVYLKAQKIMQEKGLEPNGSVFEIYKILSPKEMKTTYLFTAKLK